MTSPTLKSDACPRDYPRLPGASAPPSAVQRARTQAGLHDAAEVAWIAWIAWIAGDQHGA